MSMQAFSKIASGVVLLFPGSLIGATTFVDWLDFRTVSSGLDYLLIGSDDDGNDLVEVRIETVAGTFVPGSPSPGFLSKDHWTLDLPYRDSVGNDSSVSTFRTQATGFGGAVNYTVEVDFLVPKSGLVFGMGQLFASVEGGTGAVNLSARNSVMESVTIQEPAIRSGWDNGISRHTLPLQWSTTFQSLSVGGLDPQARNSQFAFFDMGSETIKQILFEVPQGYERGSGDALEFAIGVSIPEPSGGLLVLTAVISAALRRRRDS